MNPEYFVVLKGTEGSKTNSEKAKQEVQTVKE
jgi:hypothetical protein